jgi:hypothetical protein
MTVEQQIWEQLLSTLDLHAAHTWKQVSRCVYCDDCGVRLYQGTLPADRRKPRKPPPEPAATTEMRNRWRKD